MSTQTHTTERIAAAGCSRAAVSPSYVGVVSATAGTAAFAAAFRGWGANPTMGMSVPATKRHDLIPAPRPEEGSP